MNSASGTAHLIAPPPAAPAGGSGSRRAADRSASPLTPTNNASSGSFPDHQVVEHLRDGLDPHVAAADADDVAEDRWCVRLAGQRRADLLGEDPGMTGAHVAVQHGHLAPSGQQAPHLVDREGAEGDHPQQARP